MRNRVTSSVFAVVIAVCLVGATAAAAQIPPPKDVPGKEYSNNFDETWAGALDPLQNIAWDGLGNAWDTFDYNDPPYEDYTGEVDALANIGDAYYWEVVNDKVPLLTSFQADGNIYYQQAGVDTTGIWATPPIINATAPPDDVDGLEVWGLEVYPPKEGSGSGTGDDANMFSLFGDPGGTAVFTMNWGTYITTAQIAGVIDWQYPEDINLDAMMIYDGSGDDYFGNDPKDSIMFSIQAIPGAFDGGEVWVWTPNGAPNGFLIHGGEKWNTAHTVGADFGVKIEEVNALEAVIPEPATLALLALGSLGMLRRRRG